MQVAEEAEAHLFLGTVGTSTASQGNGLATRTLTPLLDEGDTRNLDVLLETSSLPNVDFYRRLGFDIADHLTIDGGGPPVWLMVRKPGVGPTIDRSVLG